MEQTEILIVEQLRQGREAAYKFLYDHHYLVLCHVAEQYVKDSFLSETIVSDVIFHLWEIHETLEIHTSIRSYLVQAVRNRCLNFLNSQVTKRENTLSKIGLAEMPMAQYRKTDDYPLGRLLSEELEKEVQAAIERLPQDCQKVFRMSRFQGMKYQEIALELGISVNTVKYHIKRALALLQGDLRKYLFTAFILFMQD